MIKLYDFLPCPFGQKVRIVLAEKSLTYDLVEVDLLKGEQRRPEFLRLNPFGKVPVLIDEDTTIYDSTIINEYLDDEYPDPPLLPAVGASSLRARARLFEELADSSFTPQVGQLMAEVAKPESERDPNRVQRFRQAVERLLDYLNHELDASTVPGHRVLGCRYRLRAAPGGAPRVWESRRAADGPTSTDGSSGCSNGPVSSPGLQGVSVESRGRQR